MRKLLLLPAILSVSSFLTAQTLIPYLGKDGLKGLADTEGKLLIDPQFTELDYIVGSDKPYFYAKKDGVRKRVLRNGEMFDDKGGGGTIKYVVNYAQDKKQAAETWKHVVAMDFPDKCLFVNTRTGQQFTCARLQQNSNQGWFPVDNHTYLGTGVSWNAARFGLVRVEIPGKRYNLIDAELNPVFQNNFAAVTVVDDEYCLVANDENKVAVANRKGEILSKFNWQLLLPTEQKGLFITEPRFRAFRYQEDDSEPPAPQAEGGPAQPVQRAKTGLIDASGKYIVAPKLVDLRLAGSRFLIFEKEKSTGTMDYAGNVIWETSLENSGARIEHAFDGFFIHQSQLINEKGQPVLDFEYDNIVYEKEKFPDHRHFYFQKGEMRGLLNEYLNVVFEGKLSAIVPMRQGDELFFETKDISQQNRGLLDASAKVLFPTEYSKFEFPYNLPFIKLSKGEKQGLSRLDGSLILPCEFDEVYFSTHKNGVDIYGKPAGKHTYLGFDENGQRLPENDCLHPMHKKDKLVYQPPAHRGQPQPIIFADGKMAFAPEAWGGGRQNLKGMGTPDDFIIIKENPSNYELYDSEMRPLLPAGFSLPRKHFNARRGQHLSIVAAFQENPGFQPPPPPKEQGIQLLDAEDESAEPPTVEVDMPEMVDVTVEENGPDYIGTGVLNSRGEWLLPPARNVRYQPVSNHLVLEYVLDGTERQKKYPQKLHRVNHPQPASWPIAFAQDIENGQPFDNAIVWQQQDKPGGEGKVNKCTWFGADGRQFSDFKYLDGPRRLTAQNLVALEENGVKKYLLVNQDLEKIADLPADWEMPGGGVSLHFGYLPVKKEDKYGLMDSIGQLVMPIEYSRLTIVKNLPLVEEAIEQPSGSGKYQVLLRDFSGKVLGESQSRINAYDNDEKTMFFIVLDEGKATVRTLVFNKKGEQMLEVPSGKFVGMEAPIGSQVFGKFLSPDKQFFWVDLGTGQAFRE